MAGQNGSMDVIVQIGEAVERVERFPALPNEPEETVTLIFSLGGATTLSMTFGAAAFLRLARRLARVSETLPGPS